jgi:hypothetical protein
MSLRDTFFSKVRARKIVPVGAYFVRELSADLRDVFESYLAKNKDGSPEGYAGFRARLVAQSLCDAEGKLVFTDADVKQLGDCPADELDPYVEAAIKLNGLNAKAAEEVGKG